MPSNNLLGCLNMNTRVRNLSIKGKLAAIILASSLLSLALVSATLISNEFIRLKYNLSSDLTALAEIMGTNCEIGVAFDDSKACGEVLKSLIAKPNIVYAQVFKMKGEIFTRYDRPGESPQTHENILTGDDAGYVGNNRNAKLEILEGVNFFSFANYAVAVRKIVHDGRLLGGIVIRSDLGELKSRLFVYIGTMFTVMFIALGLTLILAARLQRIITHTITHKSHK